MLGPAWVLPSFAAAASLSQGGGCALMNRSAKFQQIVRGMDQVCRDVLTFPTQLCALLTALIPAGAGRAADSEDPHGRPGACEPGTQAAAQAAGLGGSPGHGGSRSALGVRPQGHSSNLF